MTLKICVVGTQQSGSTRLFNLVRLMYEKKKKSVSSSAYVHNGNVTDDTARNDPMKTESVANKNIYSKKKRGRKSHKSNSCDSYICKKNSEKNENERANNPDITLIKVHDIDFSFLNKFDIILLPIRNLLDSAISSVKRGFHKDYLSACLENIRLFEKFKDHSNFIFFYEKYSVHYIKKLCKIMRIRLDNMEIISIMNELDKMHNSTDIVPIDDMTNSEYRKTLLSRNHNTSGGMTNKFVNMSNDNLKVLLDNKKILDFLENHKYI
jgi:hypothetical protein